jgi:hypothetical protein
LIFAVALVPLSPARADDAILLDGRRLTGGARLDENGRLRFYPQDRSSSLGFEEIAFVRFPAAPVDSPGANLGWRVRLQDGQGFTAQLMACDDKTLQLRTAWADGLMLVRSAVAAADRVVPELHRPDGDPSQDEVWLLSGDQLFGDLLRLDPHRMLLRGGTRMQEWSWDEVRGIRLRRQSWPVRTTDGEHVRLWLRSPGVADEIEGVLGSLDHRRLGLHHALLGDLVIDRGRVQRLRWLFRGRRIEVDNGSHHLGPRGALVAGLHPERAEALSLTRTFWLEGPVRPANLLVWVARLKGPEDGIARALQSGGLRTEVLVNGQRVEYLNRLVDRAEPEPRALRVALPANLLRAGENVLELRQTPEQRTERYESCGVIRLVVEVPMEGA